MAVLLINLSGFEPDRAGHDGGVVIVANNTFPIVNGWGPMPSLAAYFTEVLPGDCRGFASFERKNGEFVMYAGTVDSLYRLDPGGWVDVTRTAGGNYSTPIGSYWRFKSFGDLVIAVNGYDAPQVVDYDAGVDEFANLDGSPPIADDIGIVGDFVFLNDVNNRRRLIYCGTSGPNTATSWTVGTDLCDEYIAPDGGNIATPPMLGEFGLFIQSEGTARRVVLQAGDPDRAFRFEKLEGVKGAIRTYSAIASNSAIFYLTEDGFYALDAGGNNVPIGEGKVNKYFRQNTDVNRLSEVLAFYDPFGKRVFWAHYFDDSSQYFDRLIGYDTSQQRFFTAEITAQHWGTLATPGQTLEGLDALYATLDVVPVSLDSAIFSSSRAIGAFDGTGLPGSLSGNPLDATIRISPTHFAPPGRAILKSMYPIGQTGSAEITARVGKAEYAGGSTTWAGPYPRSTVTGRIYTGIAGLSAKTHTLEINIPSHNWTDIQQIGTEEQPDGQQ